MKKTFIAAFALLALVLPFAASAQSGVPSTNFFDSKFAVVTCDGPALPPSVPQPTGAAFLEQYGHPEPYRVCDFKGLMIQIQHIINIMIVGGVLVAIVSFSYAGSLYVRNASGAKDHAKDIFKNTGIGFIMMVSAWFIVWQILDWLASNPGVKSLLIP